MNEKEKDFYQKLRRRANSWLEKNLRQDKRWTEFVLLAPDIFHLLTRLVMDEEVPRSKKVKLGIAIAYFISPVDLLPEALLGPIGYLDDVALAAYVLNDIINDVDPQIIIRNWAGDQDILNLVKTILLNSDRMLGSGLWKKIKNRI
jgi:uncharacterized membrane protein YkvA (DUF1232 family)